MIFETKYNTGDYIYIVTTIIEKYKIDGIKIVHNRSYHNQIMYQLGANGREKREDEVYATREEAAKKWLSKQGINCGVVGI